MLVRPGGGSLGLVLVLCASGAAYAQNLGNPFFGSDTWPWLVSTRVDSASDAVRVAFSPIMSGTSFVAEVAHFYHPLTALSYSLDQALFGLNPMPFYATNLLIHLVAVAALYSLARGLGATRWSSAAGALLLGLHPVAAATVPSLPRRQDLVVGAMLIGSMSLLARAPSAGPRLRQGWVVAAMALYVLALGGKEIAYAGLAVVPFVLACGWLRTHALEVAPGQALKLSAGVLAAFVVLELAGFGVRWAVLGGLGGYNGSASNMGSTQGIVEFFVRPYITNLVWPWHTVLPDRLRDWLLVVSGAAAVVAIATTGFTRPRQMLVVTGLVWQAAFLLLYAVVHTSLSAYLAYVPLAGLALVVCALLDGAAELLQAASTRAWTRVTQACALAAALGSTLLLVGVVRTSALFTDYPEFKDAAAATRQFSQQALPCLAAVPTGAPVTLDGLPHRIDYGSSDSQLIDAYVFEAYSVESLLRVLAQNTHAQVLVRSTQDLTRRPPEVSLGCAPDGDGWRITTRVQQ